MRAKKRFGQHFLTDGGVIERLLAIMQPQTDDYVIEIGPGQGALTWPLLAHLPQLWAIEKDWDMIPQLNRRVPANRQLHLINQDVLTVDLARLLPKGAQQWRVVGNLPYNISTPLLFHCFAQQSVITDMHFMLQKEVVDRMVATPGSSQYGRLSVMCQWAAHLQFLFDVPASAFSPPPRVESAIVRIQPRRQPPVAGIDQTLLATIVSCAFRERRKCLRNSLRQFMAAQDWQNLGVDANQRAQSLSWQDFAAITEYCQQEVPL